MSILPPRPKSLKYLLSGPLQQMFADFCSRARSHPGHLEQGLNALPLKPDVLGVYAGSVPSCYVIMS